MGTTKSLLFIENQAFTKEKLKKIINQLAGNEKRKDQFFFSLLQQFMTPEMIQQAEAERKQMENLFQFPQGNERSKAILAYREDLRWIPLFVESLCDGHIVCSEELRKLSQTFRTPVFAFAIYDSDALFVSYCDETRGILYDYIKPNFQEFAEYDSDVYFNEFPQFLLDLCNAAQQERLLSIWNEANVNCADDRMEKLAELLEMKVCHDFSSDSSGFQWIRAK